MPLLLPLLFLKEKRKTVLWNVDDVYKRRSQEWMTAYDLKDNTNCVPVKSMKSLTRARLYYLRKQIRKKKEM